MTTFNRALVWEKRGQDTDTPPSPYWDDTCTLLSSLLLVESSTSSSNDDLVSMSCPLFLALTVHLVRNLRSKIQEIMQANNIVIASTADHDDDHSSTTIVPGVPIAVAIPEGPLLPLAVAAVHCLNNINMSTGNGNTNFYGVLIPLEPNEGKQRLQHMLADARPALILCAADCDIEKLQQAILSLKEEEETVIINSKKDSEQGLVRVQRLEFVDMRDLVRLAVADVEQNIHLLSTLHHQVLSDPSCEQLSIQELVEICERVMASPSPSVSASASEQSSRREKDKLKGRVCIHMNNRISHIVYTSGTTGVPKGCISSSRALAHYLDAKNQAHGINGASSSTSSSSSSPSVVLLASALAFDPCLSDILATLQTRAVLGLARRDELASSLCHTLQSLRVTHVLCTPTLWSTLQAAGVQPCDLPLLQYVALGGEPIPKQMVRMWGQGSLNGNAMVTHKNNSQLALYATFGVTEACVYQTMGQVFREGNEPSVGQDVGLPFGGLGVRICLESNQERLEDVDGNGYPSGVGEVVIYGAQIDEYSGYLGRPELRYKFVYDMSTGNHYYRTGDRGYLDPNTLHLFILGRIQGEDGMVKFNGIRVELGEIESSLLDDPTDQQQHPVVVDALVVASQGDSNRNSSATSELIAYLVLGYECKRELGLQADIPTSGVLCTTGPLLVLLRERCKQKARITPSVFVLLPRVPLSRTGKRDRQGGPLLNKTVPLDSLFSTGDQPSVALREYGTAGAIVAKEIIDCLNLQRSQEALLTTSATFPMLGGDSLAATRVMRSLYAYHNNIYNSRFLGGKFGELSGEFKVVHLLAAANLGAYIDWLDHHSLCQPRTSPADAEPNEDATPSQNNQTVAVTDDNDQAATTTDNKDTFDGISSIRESEASQLYDALLQAATRGCSTIAKGLLDVGADPNLGKHNGRLGKTSGRNERKTTFRSSPLHLACLKGNPSLIQKLLEHHAQPNTPDASGLFPIHLAASTEHSTSTEAVHLDEDLQRLECVKLLLKSGVLVTMKDASKQTVLHAAARSGFSQLLRYVLQQWKDLYASDPKRRDGLQWRDRWFRTPVHWAVMNQRIEALTVLLEMGCHPDPPNPKQSKIRSSAAIESPLEMCSRLYGNSDVGVTISKLLYDAIANKTKIID